MVGFTWPLTVRTVGASLLMSAGIRSARVTWRSLSSRMCSVTFRAGPSRSGSPSTTIVPDMPPKTCPSTRGCTWGWYQ